MSCILNPLQLVVMRPTLLPVIAAIKALAEKGEDGLVRPSFTHHNSYYT
jgi:hypothetical protein